MTIINHKEERDKDVDKIKNSTHPRKVIVAGPGTGKSFLFSELIKKKRSEGKTNFLAITFIGKLGDALADDLCGLAETVTMHSFARSFFLKHCINWNYYPKMYELIKEDLNTMGIENFTIGDDEYKEKTTYYKAVGDADVVYYAVQICKKYPNKIPVYDLILIDEYQDFNEIESEFVDLLAQKNEIVIVGDDDQALYEFKGSSPSFIRDKYHVDNVEFESHTLRFCSRCTEVIVKYFHDIATKFNLNHPEKNRIQKDYICYVPDKAFDSSINPKIHLIKNCPVGMIAYKIQSELQKLVSEQKIKSVLVIGEGKSCSSLLNTVAAQLIRYGFRNVDSKVDSEILNIKQNIIDAYKFLKKDEDSVLGWRILGKPTDQTIIRKHRKNAKTLNIIITATPKKIDEISATAIESLESEIVVGQIDNKDVTKKVLIKQLKGGAYIPRPLSNLDITVCNILNSKGLGADIVFLIGFDQGKFPAKDEITDSEIYQMLVAITRAKKRIYLINTVDKPVSNFIECINQDDLIIYTVESR